MSYRNLIISSAQMEFATELNMRPDYVNGIPNQVVKADVTAISQLCPVSPVTGFRDSDLARLFSPAVSNKEKELIIDNFTQVKGKSSPKDLSDDELLQLIPPRYLSDAVEIQKYLDMLKDIYRQESGEQESGEQESGEQESGEQESGE